MATGTLKTSILQYGSNSHVTTSEEANYFASDFIVPGITGTIANTNGFAPSTGGFAVNQESVAAMQVQITGSGATVGAYISAVPQGQDAQNLRVNLIGNTDLTIAANSSGVTKYDWIYLKVDPTLANNPDVNATTVASFVISRSTSNSTDNGGLAPTYGMLLAVVTVINGAVSITSGNIQDRRISAAINAPLNLASSGQVGWSPLSGLVFSYASNNGRKEFTVTNGTNLSTLLAPGMQFQIARTTTPGTQSMAFSAASLQYATKVSPTGTVSTFTGPFTCESWVYLKSYTLHDNVIVNRFDGGGSLGGWIFFINANAQLAIDYGTGSSFTSFVSYQSIELFRWTHTAAAVTSEASKTGQVYINGTAVPQLFSLTAATTLTQPAIDLRVGAYAGTPANSYFDGYLSEVRVWNVAQSQASIQNNMGINCLGTEPNLIFCLPGNGNFTDITASANSLTGTNGAVATQLANPFNAIEYAIIRDVVFNAGTTTITLWCGDAGTIPNQTLTNPYYSTSKTPFGWPNLLKKELVDVVKLRGTPGNNASSSLTQINGLSITFTVPSKVPTRYKITAFIPEISNTSITTPAIALFDGVVGSGIQLGLAVTPSMSTASFISSQAITLDDIILSPGVHTLNAAWKNTAGIIVTPNITTIEPAYFEVEPL